VPGTLSYNLGTGSANVYAGAGVDSQEGFLRYVDGQPMAHMYLSYADYTTGSILSYLTQAPYENILDAQRTRINTTARPSQFSIRSVTPVGGEPALQLDIDASPDASYWLALRIHDPEVPIDVDGGSYTRPIYCPDKPIVALATLYALNERGEEMGEPGGIAERRYYNLLSQTIEADTIKNNMVNDREFYRD
jgi:hypothetical protein